MNHLAGLYLQIHYFSPIVFQGNALIPVSHYTKAKDFLQTTLSPTAFSNGGYVISYSKSYGTLLVLSLGKWSPCSFLFLPTTLSPSALNLVSSDSISLTIPSG